MACRTKWPFYCVIRWFARCSFLLHAFVGVVFMCFARMAGGGLNGERFGWARRQYDDMLNEADKLCGMKTKSISYVQAICCRLFASCNQADMWRNIYGTLIVQIYTILSQIPLRFAQVIVHRANSYIKMEFLIIQVMH